MNHESTLQPSIQFTDAAAQHLLKMVEKTKQAIGFRLSVKKTGCSGYMYMPEIITSVKPQDLEIPSAHGFKIYVDPKWSDLLDGTHIDFIKKGLGKQLQITNPRAESHCGCGESFNVKDKHNHKAE